MAKSRLIKSKLAKTRFNITEQRIRLFERAKQSLRPSGLRKVNYRKPLEYTKRIPAFIHRKPFISFFIVLALLATLIILGSTVFKAKPLEEQKGDGVKQVETFKIGSSPKISVQAKVEKTGVIKIAAQTPGIVSSINTYEGELVERGRNLISLSSNYHGGNAASIGRQIAQSQYNLTKQTFDTQIEVIEKQKKIAERSDSNNDEMRDIANRSLEESRSLLDLNESLLGTINSNLNQYTATNSAGVNDNLIFQTNSQKSQLLAAINQLKGGIRNTELQAGSDKPPADLSNLQREVTLKNLEIQEKSLQIGLEVSRLQLVLAQVNEATMFPATPFKGVVEKVHVAVGESVNPGTTLVTISGVQGKIILDAKVPAATAKNLSKLENSTLQVKDQSIEVMPAYISTEATEGQLYSVIYHIPDQYQEFFTDGGFVTVSIPVGSPDTNSVVPFLPLDSIFQTQEESTVYIVKDGKAQARKIQLGEVQGGYVAVMEGVGAEDEIILSRNVVEGDKVRVNQQPSQ